MKWRTLQQLKSKKPEVRREALARLGLEMPREAVQHWTAAARDPDAQVRRAAILLLGKSKEPAVLGTVRAALGDSAWEVREAAAQVLGESGDSSLVEALVPLLQDSRHQVRYRAARSLGALGWRPANEEQRAQWAIATGKLGRTTKLGSGAVDLLISALKDTQYPYRRAAAEKLGIMADPRAIVALLAALKDEDPSIRVAAVDALEDAREPRVVEAVTAALQDEAASVREAAANALGRLGDPGTVPALLAALEDPTWAVRKSAVEALGRMRNPESVEAIASLLGDSDQDVRETAVVALGEMGEARVIPQLVAALADPLSSVRQLAAAALHKLDRRWERSELARQAIPALQSAAGDTEYWVRHSALEVLKRLQRDRSAEAEPPVLNENVRAFRSAAGQVFCHALRSANRDLRIAAAESLGRLGDVLHAVPLVAALEDADPWVRRAAAGSLRALSWQPANEQQQDLFAKAMG